MPIADDTGFLKKGGERRADALIAAVPPRSWQTISAGAGAHGWREYDWARIPVRTGWRPGCGHWLLARRSISDPACLLRLPWARPVQYRRPGLGPGSLSYCRGSLALAGWPLGDGRYGFVSTALSRKDATAPFASSGAFGLVLHWPLCLPDVYLGTSPAP